METFNVSGSRTRGMWSSCKKDVLAGRYVDFYGLAELRCDASTEFDFDTVYTV